MPIHLDWNFESDDLPDENGPRWQPDQDAGRRRSWLIGLVVTLIALGAAAGGGWARLRQVDSVRTQILEDTIAAETLALRIGDRDAFMLAQAHIERWPDIQRLVFDSYQEGDARIVATGEIIEMEVDGESAWVTLRETVDDVPHLVVWYYRYEANRWEHAPAPASPSGEIETTQSRYYDIQHGPADRLYAEQIGQKVDEQVERLCQIVPCSLAPDRPEIQIETDPLAFLFITSYSRQGKFVPSTQLLRVPENGLPEFSDEMAMGIVVNDRAFFMLSPSDSDEGSLLGSHLDIWLSQRLLQEVPPGGLYATFEALYGPDFVPDMLALIAAGTSTRTAARQLLDEGLQQMHGGLIEDELATLLLVETGLRRQGYSPQATYLFADPTRPYTSSEIDLTSPVLDFAARQDFTVTSVQLMGDVLWAEVEYMTLISSPDTEFVPRHTLQAFREVDGQWYRAEAQRSDWGALDTIGSEHVILSYQSMDLPYAGDVLTRMEAVMDSAITVFAVEGDPVIEVRLTPRRDDLGLVEPPSDAEHWASLVLPSPMLAATDNDRYLSRDPFKQPALYGMLSRLLEESLGRPGAGFIEGALVRYVAQRHQLWVGETSYEILRQNAAQGADMPLLPLDALMDDAQPFTPEYAIRQITADALIDVLVRDFGPDILPVMVKHLRDEEDAYGWLVAVFADLDSQELWPYASDDYYGRITLIEGEVLSLAGREITNITDVQTP